MRGLYFTGLLATVSLTVNTEQSIAQITPEQVATIKNVSSIATSANGKYIAYTLSIPSDAVKENAGNKSHLYLYNTQTGTSKPVYTVNSVSQIAFRPETGSITFLARPTDDTNNSLFEINVDGGEAKKIFTYTSNITSYKWNNKGTAIAFISTEKGIQPKSNLSYKPTFFEENYSNRNLYIVNFNGDNTNAPTKINTNGSVYLITWNATDDKLAISTAPTSSVDDSYMKQTIDIIDIAQNTAIANIDHKGKLAQITWSPDGKQIAILGAFDINDPTDGTIALAPATGGKPKVILGDFKGKFEAIEWIQQKQINFLASEGISNTIGSIQLSNLKINTGFKSAEHNITAVSYGKNGHFFFTANTPAHPSELFSITGKGPASLTRNTNHNAWLDKLNLGKQEVVTYTTRDGAFEIQGMLIYPVDYKEGTSYPLITVVHGGPESHYANGWLTGYSNPGQMGATKGYAVFYPNYRGSTGRGTAFTYSSQGDLAGKEFDDIVDGVDYLIAKGIADKNRIGVTGGSYGGYASAWMSTYYSHKFAAAVMFVGISNNISKFGTSDIPSEMALVHERGYVWDDWQKQLEISPIYHVDKAQTPILIMHGAEDPRVHPAQSMELYRHIKVRKPDVPVRLIYYPGEGHGNARSGSKYDYNIRLFQWFDAYLKTGNRKAAMPTLDLP